MFKSWIICKRELSSYFSSPIAYVFIVGFLLLSGFTTFYLGDFFSRGEADLAAFFSFQPWLYAIFLPVVAMRLWSEERKTGTIELLFSLPITPWQAIFGKYLAAFIFTMLALVLTSPLWLAVNYLGHPDNGVILASYIGSLLAAGGYLAISACFSALSKNQIVSYLLAVMCCLAVNLLGWFPQMCFLSNFDAISRGLLDIRSIIYFASTITFALFANTVLVELKRAD